MATKTTNTIDKDYQLRLEALRLATATPEVLTVANGGLLGTAQGYYQILKNGFPKPPEQATA